MSVGSAGGGTERNPAYRVRPTWPRAPAGRRGVRRSLRLVPAIRGAGASIGCSDRDASACPGDADAGRFDRLVGR